jgi:NADPH2:quinone reductase
MRAVVCQQWGPVEDLVVEERPSPALGPDDVRVEVSACGVNYVEGLMVQGLYQVKIPPPFVPGMEVVGRISEVGDAVTTRTVGERVFAGPGIGGYVSEAVLPADRCVVLPEAMSDGQAATFMQSYVTGWFALTERVRVDVGQRMLVLGAGGGIGLAAVDIGRALGLEVYAAASSAEKLELARRAGASELIDSSSEDVKERAKELSGGGVDLVYDPVGGELGESCLRALGLGGTYLVVGFVGGIPQMPANQILLRNRTVAGIEWGGWAMHDPERNQELVEEVLALIGDGRLNPVEPTTYPLEQAGQALKDLADRKVAGKVALVP